MTKELVEKWWIDLYDKIEPLDKPLSNAHKIRSEQKAKIRGNKKWKERYETSDLKRAYNTSYEFRKKWALVGYRQLFTFLFSDNKHQRRKCKKA